MGIVEEALSKNTPKTGIIDEATRKRSIVDEALAGAKYAGGALVGAGEIAANLATQSYGLPARGYGEIANLLTGRTDLADKVSNALIYEPQTEQGKAGMMTVGVPFDHLHRGGMWVGEKVRGAVTPILGETAGNVAATTVGGTIEAIPLLTGEAFGIGKRGIAKVRDTLAKPKETPKIAEEALADTGLIPVKESAPVTPTPEKGLFPGQETFKLVEQPIPEGVPKGEFKPVTAEQPLLTGTERAYRDVGMKDEVATSPVAEQIDSLRSILPDFELGKRLWSADGREVIGNTPNMYPPWFKEVFKNDSAKEVMSAIDKWKKSGDSSLSKKESRIVSSVKDLAQDAVERGEDIGESHWRYLMNDAGSAPAITDAAKHFKEFWSPFSTVPQGKEYLALRYTDLFGGLARVDRIIGKLSERYKELDYGQKADIFNAIRGEIPLDQIPTELQTIVKQTRADLNRTGEMLVKRGMMKRETFEANKDAYIHYLYLRHLLPDDARLPIGSGGRMDLSYLKQRKDLPEQVRQELGLVEDVSVAAPVGMGKALGDIVKSDFFKKIANNPEWVWQPSRQMAALAREYKAYKQIVDRGENVGPEVIANAQRLEADLQAASAQAGKVPSDFIQLPDSKAYGDLAGTFVRREIANDIIPVASVNPGELAGLARIWSKLGKGFDVGMTAFKMGKVALNPPTMVRNSISNVIQMNMSGIPVYRLPDVLIDGVQSMIAKDKHYRLLERNGGFKTNFSVAELGEVLESFKAAKGGGIDKLLGGVTKLSKYYGRIDDIAKMSLFKDAVTRQGMNVPDAVLYAQKWGMDYSLASRSVKHARRYVLPFISYQYKIAPLIAETLVKRPWVLAKYAAIPYALSQWAAGNFDWTDKDLDKAQKMMTERTKHQGAYTLLPIKDSNGNVEIVNLEYFLPWGNWMEAARSAKGGEVLDTLKQFGGIAGPYGNIFTMMNTKKEGEPPVDPFSGRKVYSPLDSPADKYRKQVEWWWQIFGPSSMSSSGALGYTYKAMTGQKDRWGVEATPGKTFLKWMGANVGSLNPQQIIVMRKYKLRELDSEIKRILHDPKYSKEDRKNAITQLQIERKKILNPE